MDRYNITILPSAKKDIKRIGPKTDRNRIWKKISALRNNPRPPGCQKISVNQYYRVRQGNYRIVYEIRDKEVIVTIVRVAHRKDVYR